MSLSNVLRSVLHSLRYIDTGLRNIDNAPGDVFHHALNARDLLASAMAAWDMDISDSGPVRSSMTLDDCDKASAELWAAVLKDDLELCKSLIRKYFSVYDYGQMTRHILPAVAEGGIEIRSLQMCQLAHSLGCLPTDWLIHKAAIEGVAELCELAKKWGMQDYSKMIMIAAEYGHLHLCQLGIQWSNELMEEDVRGTKAVDVVLYGGGLAGNLQVCAWGRDHGARNFTLMLNAAAHRGHLDACKLAVEWGAVPIRTTLSFAIRSKNLTVCSYVLGLPGISVGVEDLIFAARHGNVQICQAVKNAPAKIWTTQELLEFKKSVGNYLCMSLMADKWMSELQQ